MHAENRIVKLDDYIKGARRGREAHEIELEAMGDQLLADALDGFDAVPGNHAAALERLFGAIRGSAAIEGRVSARVRASRLRERNVRIWSVAAAAVFIACVAGGVWWMFRDGISADTKGDVLARRTGSWSSSSEPEAILPPVTVIREEDEAEQAIEATDISSIRLDRKEFSGLAEAIAAAPLTSHDEATTPAITPAAAIVPGTDTTQTAEFRRYIHEQTVVRSAVLGPVFLSFEVDADGRPVNISVVEAPARFPEAAGAAIELLKNGPDWPTEPNLKLIRINL